MKSETLKFNLKNSQKENLMDFQDVLCEALQNRNTWYFRSDADKKETVENRFAHNSFFFSVNDQGRFLDANNNKFEVNECDFNYKWYRKTPGFVFLGGTCNNSTWREELIPELKMDYFNPIVEDWNEQSQKLEKEMRKNASVCLYVVTNEMTGVYSIAEVIDDSNKRPSKTVFSFIRDGFSESQIKSLESVGRMVKENGGMFLDYENVAAYING